MGKLCHFFLRNPILGCVSDLFIGAICYLLRVVQKVIMYEDYRVIIIHKSDTLD